MPTPDLPIPANTTSAKANAQAILLESLPPDYHPSGFAAAFGHVWAPACAPFQDDRRARSLAWRAAHELYQLLQREGNPL